MGRWIIAVTAAGLALTAAIAVMTAQTSAVAINGVTCEQSETASGITACLTAATLDGGPFPFNFSPAGESIDLDQDGIRDLILSSNWAVQSKTPVPVKFFRNRGNGKDFVSVSPPVGGVAGGASAMFARNVIVGDFNSDGKDDFYLADAQEVHELDLASSFDGTPQYLYLASGSGGFNKMALGIGNKVVHGAAALVPSKDGLALALNTPWQNFRTSPNMANFISIMGSGAVAARQVLWSEPLFAPFNSTAGAYPYLTTIDANGDGIRDVVMLGRYMTNENTLWLNDGKGNFTVSKAMANWEPGTAAGLYMAENAAVGDLNGDGLQDMIVMHIDRRQTPNAVNSTLRVWLNDGKGSFTDSTATWLGTAYQDYVPGFFDYRIADVDDDGLADVVFTTQVTRTAPGKTANAKIVVLKNSGGKKFEEVTFNILKWAEPLQRPDQWMPGSVVPLLVNGKPTVLFSKAGAVYSVRFRSTATAPFTVASNGGSSSTSGNTTAAATPGYGSITMDGAGATPAGLAIFSFRQNGILVSEAAVPASSPMLTGRIYAEVNGPVNTGLALANPNNKDAKVSFYFTDQSGSNFGSGTMTIPARAQTAAFLDQPPFRSGPSVKGTFTFSSDTPVAVVALRGLANERGEFLITTLPVSSLTPATGQAVFPHFADGGGWSTQFVLVNPTDSTLTGTLQFLSQGSATSAASPLSITMEGQAANTFAYSIPARSAKSMKTPGTASTIQSGSVRIIPDANNSVPTGLGVFSYKQGGFTVSEAGVPAVTPSTAVRLYAEMSGGTSQIQTGIALANVTATPATATIELSTLAGEATGLVGRVSVPGNGQVAMFLNQVPGLTTLAPPFQGVMRITTTSPAVSVVGLRGRYNERGDFLITTTTPVPEGTASTGSIFPHLVDGGGYSTQVILFAVIPGLSASGAVRFNSQSGLALPLGFQFQ